MKPFMFELPILPAGFIFPVDYKSTVTSDVLPNIEPWQFLSQDMPRSLSYYGNLLIKFPDRPLIPFAIINDESGFYNDGWIVLACFDGNNHTGLPSVFIYDYSTPKQLPWENLSYRTFTEWLKAAQKESNAYQQERAEAESDN